MLKIRTCARDGCDEGFIHPKCGRRLYCSPRCAYAENDRRRKENYLANPVVRKERLPSRKSRAVARVKLDARVCRGCDQQFDPLRRNQSHCLVCRPMEEFRRCEDCQKPFRVATKASRFCGPDCRARYHDRMHRDDTSPVDGFDENDEEDEAVILELDDAPRRKRLFEMLVSYGHPTWPDAELPPPPPSDRHKRPSYAEQAALQYRNGFDPSVRFPWRHGR